MAKCYNCVHLIVCGWLMGGANLTMASLNCKNYENKAEHDGCDKCKWQTVVDGEPCNKCKGFYTDLWEIDNND